MEKLNLKQIINDYFNRVINTIEIDTQSVLLKKDFFLKDGNSNENQIQEALFNDSLEEISSIKEQFIKECNSIREFNLECLLKNTDASSLQDKLSKLEVDKSKSPLDLQEIKNEIFKKYCFYLKRDNLFNYPEYNKIGILIILDYYMPDLNVETLKFVLLFYIMFLIKCCIISII